MRVFAFMKTLFFILILQFSFHLAQAQAIVIQAHEKEVTMDIDQLGQFKGPQTSGGCSVVTSSYKDQKASGGCAGVLIREYTFTDNCGQHANTTIFIHLKDNTPPVFDQIPADATASDEKNLPTPSTPTATDNSGTIPEIILSEKKEKNQIIRTWKATDDCGNSSEIVQKIKVLK